MTAPIEIRDSVPSDLPLFYSVALRSYYYSGIRHPYALFKGIYSGKCRNLPKDAFFREHAIVLNNIIKRSDAKLILATDPEYNSVIWGALLYSPGILHYTYVKKPFREKGIAAQLWRHAGFGKDYTVSHYTYDMSKIASKNRAGIIYNPEIWSNDDELTGTTMRTRELPRGYGTDGETKP